MMRKVTPFILAMLLLAFMAFPHKARMQSPQGGGENIYFSGEIVGPLEVVLDAPYTATAVIENTQILADGNRIVHDTTQLVARDSKGRIRREQTIDAIGPIKVNGPKVIFIIDPVAQRQYILNTRAKTAEIKKLPNIRIINPRENKTENARERKSEKESSDRPQEQLLRADRARINNSVGQESLGTKVMEGINVEGEINKWTIPARSIGNERPIDISVETWYSPDLHITVLRHRIDPRFGDVMYRLTNIQRTEPNPSLFKIPAGYKKIINTL